MLWQNEKTHFFVTSSMSEQQIHNWASLCHQSPCRKIHFLWKLWHLSTTARHVKDLWHCWSKEAHEHIGFHPNQMWTPHDACTYQWSGTKCKDWKYDWLRHPHKHQILALLFILYLAFAVKPLPPVISAIDYHRLFWSLLDWIINWDVHEITIDWKFADDISFLRSEELKINQVEREIPAMLLTKGLHVNGSKTEKYHIQRSGEDAWKKCKYLGSLLFTDKDIKREKGLIIDSYKTFESIFSGKHVSEKVKIRVFAICIQNIFMYNSELWTLTLILENSIDMFQRKLLKRIINVKWSRTICNKDLYARTKMKPWSITIQMGRLTWFGHLMLLPAETLSKST